MGRFAESMRDFWEGVGGFLSLGGRDMANKIASLVRGARVRKLEKAMAARQVELGRKAWSLKILTTDAFPVVDKIDSYERAIAAKQNAVEEFKARIGDQQKQRQEHLTLYQNKINEQMKQRQPVDEEFTGLLVEAKRLKRELALTQDDIISLERKHELQLKRLEQAKKENGEGSEEYVLSEIRHELQFIERSIVLKREKVAFLKVRLEEKSKSAERTGKVVAQYDNHIADLRKQQREGTAQFDASLHKLQINRHQIERDIRKLRREMSPLFGELGLELRRRTFDVPELAREYSEINALENEKERQKAEIDRRRSDSASIGFGIKLGFYGMILALVVLITWLLFIIF